MAAKTAAKLKEASQALLADAGPDYDIDPSEVRGLLDDIVDSVPSLGLTREQARDAAGALLAALAQFAYDKSAGALTLDLSAYAALAGATFAGAVSGPEPTRDAHLATKKYADGLLPDTSGRTSDGYLFWDASAGRWALGAGTGGGAPDPGSHNRLIGWSAAGEPTAVELAAASVETDNVLAIPSETDNGYIFFAVPQAAGAPAEAFFDGNSHDILGGFAQRSNQDVSGVTYLVFSTAAEQSASIMGTGSRTLTLAYS